MRSGTIDQLIARIGRVHRDLVIDRGDIIEWTLEAIEEAGGYDQFEVVKDLAVPVKDRRAELPANAYRLLSVRMDGCRCEPPDYIVKNSCILLPCEATEVRLDLMAFRLTEEMEPLIDDTLMKMCEAYCIIRLLTGPWMRREVRDEAFQMAKADYGRAAQEARASFRNVTQDEMDRWNHLFRASVLVSRFKRR
jgi:hypothetical protein